MDQIRALLVDLAGGGIHAPQETELVGRPNPGVNLCFFNAVIQLFLAAGVHPDNFSPPGCHPGHFVKTAAPFFEKGKGFTLEKSCIECVFCFALRMLHHRELWKWKDFGVPLPGPEKKEEKLISRLTQNILQSIHLLSDKTVGNITGRRGRTFTAGEQHDAEELATALIEKYHLNYIFGRTVVTRVYCHGCKEVRLRKDRQKDKSLPHTIILEPDVEIAGVKRGWDDGCPTVQLKQLLGRHHMKEALGQNQKVDCDKCKSKQQVSVAVENLQLPVAVLIHFKRKPGVGRKTHVISPQFLTGEELGCQAAKDRLWEAAGSISNFASSPTEGHYIAKRQAFKDGQRYWFKCNDSVITPIEPVQRGRDAMFSTTEPHDYLLLYVQVGGVAVKPTEHGGAISGSEDEKDATDADAPQGASSSSDIAADAVGRPSSSAAASALEAANKELAAAEARWERKPGPIHKYVLEAARKKQLEAKKVAAETADRDADAAKKAAAKKEAEEAAAKKEAAAKEEAEERAKEAAAAAAEAKRTARAMADQEERLAVISKNLYSFSRYCLTAGVISPSLALTLGCNFELRCSGVRFSVLSQPSSLSSPTPS